MRPRPCCWRHSAKLKITLKDRLFIESLKSSSRWKEKVGLQHEIMGLEKKEGFVLAAQQDEHDGDIGPDGRFGRNEQVTDGSGCLFATACKEV